MELIRLLIMAAISFLLCSLNMIKYNDACNPREREALINFKHNLNDSYGNLSSWVVGNDCCKWYGVHCDNKTESTVVQLQLQDFGLSGELNSSLLELKHLYHLNLSANDFHGIQIPAFLGSLQNLQYLDLHSCGFTGKVPPQLLNLSSLYYLDLSANELEGEIPITLGNLCNLEVLDLSLNKLQGEISSLLFTNSSSRCFTNKLKALNLVVNHFTGKVPPELGNLSNLYYLNLGYNKLEGEIPRTLGNLCNLELLHLYGNNLQGEIFGNSSRCFTNKLKWLNLGQNLLSGQLPDELGSLKNLEQLILERNSFSGSIPTSLGRLSLLTELDLSNNKLNGSLPESIWNLSSLERLVISDNKLEGDVTEAHFANLKKLDTLSISSMVLNLSLDWVPPFQIGYLGLQNCSIGHQFPEWLRTQKYITGVEISNSRLYGSVPSWFWNMTSQFLFLNISHNQLEGDLSNVLLGSSSWYGGRIYLNSNRFTGNLPRISSDFIEIDLSRNSFSGPISVLLCSQVEYRNYLVFLNLSGNLLSGELSECLFYWTSLVLISLENNNITGNIPSSIGLLLKLEMLHLQNNSLDGELPPSLRDCAKLRIVDLGENRLVGRLPTWIGESFKELVIMRLHSNMFYGEIPTELCYLDMLQILDMGDNNLSGSIPRCFSNFSRMGSKFYPNIGNYNYSYTGKGIPLIGSGNYHTEMKLVLKGKEWVYGVLLELIVAIDLSNNNLHGEIPEELTYLFRLRTLNLANNSLIGTIPNKIGLLSSLESLDLSNNRLSGAIPQSMVNLTWLGYLNLSCNNLSGEIPLGTQLQTFSELSFTGNHNLCGFPLNKCDEDGQHQKAPNGEGEGSMEDNEDWIEMKWFYMGLPFGFVVGFWCLWGVLLVNKSWRYAYFRFLDDITWGDLRFGPPFI